MNAVDTLRLFCDGHTSLHDIRALMFGLGFDRADFASALATLMDEPHTLRFNKYQSDELHAEMYLRLEN